jgi:hypothetical protein
MRIYIIASIQWLIKFENYIWMYGLLVEGDKRKLTYQGIWFKDF